MNCECCKVKYKQCCKDLEQAISDIASPLEYNPIDRSYSLNRELKGGNGRIVIERCPFCGKKLPSYLGNLWEKILIKEYGLDERDANLFNEDVPEEFKTDEWWKKRGL